MYTPEELDGVYELLSDPDVTRFYPADYAANREDILTSMPRRLERWRANGFGQLGAFDKKTTTLAGYCGLQYLDQTPEVELYYGFFREFWGRGLATEAAMAMLRFGFDCVGLESIVAVTHPDNHASQRVLCKVGFTPHAERRKFYGVDAVYFTFDRSDHAPSKAEYSLTWQNLNDRN